MCDSLVRCCDTLRGSSLSLSPEEKKKDLRNRTQPFSDWKLNHNQKNEFGIFSRARHFRRFLTAYGRFCRVLCSSLFWFISIIKIFYYTMFFFLFGLFYFWISLSVNPSLDRAAFWVEGGGVFVHSTPDRLFTRYVRVGSPFCTIGRSGRGGRRSNWNSPPLLRVCVRARALLLLLCFLSTGRTEFSWILCACMYVCVCVYVPRDGMIWPISSRRGAAGWSRCDRTGGCGERERVLCNGEWETSSPVRPSGPGE